MFPPNEKRTTFMYNQTPMQISGVGDYGSHPDYDYLEGRKLEDVYPSGFLETYSGRLPDQRTETDRARFAEKPAWKQQEDNRSKGK